MDNLSYLQNINECSSIISSVYSELFTIWVYIDVCALYDNLSYIDPNLLFQFSHKGFETK